MSPKQSLLSPKQCTLPENIPLVSIVFHMWTLEPCITSQCDVLQQDCNVMFHFVTDLLFQRLSIFLKMCLIWYMVRFKHQTKIWNAISICRCAYFAQSVFPLTLEQIRSIGTTAGHAGARQNHMLQSTCKNQPHFFQTWISVTSCPCHMVNDWMQKCFFGTDELMDMTNCEKVLRKTDII
jgi:hypothetical protein